MTNAPAAWPASERLEHFLFAPVNPTAVRIFRIALALMLAWTFWPKGFELARELQNKEGLSSLYQNIFLTPAYHGLIGVLLVAFGVRQLRWIGLVLVLLLLPLDFLTRGQQSRQVMLFTLLAFSLLPAKPPMPMWPIRLIQIQLTLVYGINAFVKTTPHFLSGHALIDMAQSMPNFQVNFVNGFLRWGVIALPVWLLACMTVLSEYFLAVGFWFVRWRIFVAVFGVAFHLVLKLVVKIHMLDWASMFLYLAFLLPFEQTMKQSDTTENSSPATPV